MCFFREGLGLAGDDGDETDGMAVRFGKSTDLSPHDSRPLSLMKESGITKVFGNSQSGFCLSLSLWILVSRISSISPHHKHQ